MPKYLIAEEPSLQVSLVSVEGIWQMVTLSLHQETPGFYLFWEDEAFDPTLLEKIKQWLHAYAEKKHPSLPLPTDISLFPSFTHSVLSHLTTLPFGITTTYGTIASALHKEKGARAVGNACGANPFPLFIPCHRVLAAGNTLGGFSCGLEIKKRFLSFELIPFKK